LEKVREILYLAQNGIPQALARFNDGECGIILNKNFTAARGCQKGSIELQTALIDAIRYEQKNYWKGYPCTKCFPIMFNRIYECGYFQPWYFYNTKAVVNTNRNLMVFSEGLQSALRGKKVVWVSGEDQDLSKLDFDVVEHIKAPMKNSWGVYHELLKSCQYTARPGYVYLLSCGPVARVLVRTLFEMRPDCSFLDIGDTYCPETRGVYRKCHNGTLKKCERCN
jgi:hypothetical protein